VSVASADNASERQEGNGPTDSFALAQRDAGVFDKEVMGGRDAIENT
jgi:hypothetical protein